MQSFFSPAPLFYKEALRAFNKKRREENEKRFISHSFGEVIRDEEHRKEV